MREIDADIIIIGAGAAGLAAGIGAKDTKRALKTIIIDQNEKAGKKIYITGKGRCNFTNNCDVADFLNNVVSNPKFLYSSLKALSPEKTIEMFNSWGLQSKTERGGRVFPASDKSSDVIKTLTNALKRSQDIGCELRLLEKAVSVYPNGVNGFHVLTELSNVPSVKTQQCIGGSKKDKEGVKQVIRYTAKKLIIACGGLSYPMTGSTGDGLRFAEKFGHCVVPPVSALVPIILKDKHDLEGLSLKNVRADIIKNDKILQSEFGEMLFTQNGVSGPIILSLSSKINREADINSLTLSIDLKPALSVEVLDRRLLRDFEQNINKQFKNYVDSLVPKRLGLLIMQRAKIAPEKPLNQITKKERTDIIKALKNLVFEISCLDDIKNGIVFSGGVSVKELNPNTMESKLTLGLYFAGETIDVDALTGGYNMQIAFSTGYLAGKSASESII